MQDTLYNTRKELAALVERMIDKASFRQCYERRDTTIKLFAVIAPGHSMPSVVAQMLKPGQDTGNLLANRVVGFLPPIHALLDASGRLTNCEASLRRYLEAHIDLEVRAYYSPPLYFVQFTGQRWE